MSKRRHRPSASPPRTPQEVATDAALSHFEGVKKTGKPFEFRCLCPAHDDQNPSLSIKITERGKVLLHCHAGCSQADILRVAGLQLYRSVPIVAVYPYCSESGTPLYEVYRTADKQFPVQLPDGTWGCGDLSVLYLLPELIELSAEYPDEPIFICEGEKDVDRCYDEGLTPATCIRGGASGKWRPEFNKYVSGRKVVILADNDKAGRAFANRIAAQLKDVAASVKIIEFRELPEKGDVSDFFDADGTVDQLYQRIDDTPEWTNPAPEAVKKPGSDSSLPSLTMGANRTDLANSRLFAKKYRLEVRFCSAWKRFLVFDGVRWVQDGIGPVETLAKEIADLLWTEAQAADNGELRKFAAKTASVGGIKAIVALVQSDPDIAIRPDDFDSHPMLLNCPNGTVDLGTGELRPHNRDDFLTQLCPTPFNPDAKCPLWKKTIRKIFRGDRELIGFVQRLFGMFLTGLVTEQVLVIFVGSGSNGKSLILTVLLAIIGSDYFIKASDEILVRKNNSSHPTALADLFRKRLALVMETDSGDRIAEALLKALTGGDRIRARRMREDFWEFTPTHKIALCTNHKPQVDSTDHAFWRRVRLVPFNVTFWKADDPTTSGTAHPEELRADPRLAEKLLAEAEGILAWCVHGCLEWQEQGLGSPPVVAKATLAYREDQDVLQRFLDDRCIIADEAKVRSQRLFDCYLTWCDQVGEKPLPLNQFKPRLLEHSPSITFKRSDGSWFNGIKLR